jgi:predicted porin
MEARNIMNRYLLAGCAAAALALGAGAANAQAKFEVKVGGDYYFEAGYVDDDTDGRDVEFRNRFRLVVTPQAKADNGLEYGARVRLRATGNGSVDYDRAFMFVQGGFGQIQLGSVNSYNDQTGISRPISWQPLGNWDFAAGGGSSTWTSNIPGGSSAFNVNGTSAAWPLLNPDRAASKALYISPRFAGFQAAVGYTPRNDSNGTDINRSELTSLAAQGGVNRGFEDLVEVGANYNNSFSGIEVKASAGYFMGESQVAGTEDLDAWQVGAQVGYAGFVVGGSYLSLGESGQPTIGGTDDQFNWTVGAQYTAGPLVFGLGYTYAEDAGTTAVAGARETNLYDIGVGYTVAPGLTVQAQYTYFDVEGETAATDADGNIFLVRSILAF